MVCGTLNLIELLPMRRTVFDDGFSRGKPAQNQQQWRM